MTTRPISTCQLEHAMPILADLDLAPLFEVMAVLFDPKGGTDASATAEGVLAEIRTGRMTGNLATLVPKLLPLLKTLGKAGQVHLLRRLVAVGRSSDDDLLEAEGSLAKQRELEAAAARLPMVDSLLEVFGFFERLGLSVSPSPASSEAAGEEGAAGGPSSPEAASRSADS